MGLRDELKSVQEQIEALEERKRAIYAASVAAPAEEKICEDRLAEMESDTWLAHGRRVQMLVQAITSNTVAVANGPLRRTKPGAWVAVRPCDEACAGKTYLGVYVGDIALGLSTSFHPESGVLEVKHSSHNPAIWVPDLARIVFGAESWWGEIKTQDGLKKITDADIENTWYVQALKSLGGEAPAA